MGLTTYDVTTPRNAPRVRTQSSHVQGSTITFHDINYTVNAKDPEKFFKTYEKEILRGVNGIFQSGMNAIMGPTGGGKSSLLDVLAGRKDPAGLKGQVLVDGQKQPKDFKNKSGYVVQDDIVMGTLTIRENLMFSANLRLPNSVSSEEKEKRVDDVLSELSLQLVRDSKVGTQFIRGVSGGERKRTSIGMELIISPSVLFLDEPTTGLDANTANATVALLHRLSRRGRTIILSIHQPRYSIYKLFDSLLFLGRGRTIYHGPAHDAVAFFESVGFQCEEFNNPPDFFLDAINGDVKPVLRQRKLRAAAETETGYSGSGSTDETEKWDEAAAAAAAAEDGDDDVQDEDTEIEKFVRTERSEELADEYEKTHWYSEVMAELEPIYEQFKATKHDKKNDVEEGYVTSFPVQFGYISRRATKNLLGNPQVSFVQVVMMSVMAFIVGILYFQLDNKFPNDVQNRFGVLFFGCMNAVFSNMSSLDMFIQERAIFIHENISGYYRVSSYFFGKLLLDILPMRLVPIILYSLIAYFMVGLQVEVDKFFLYLLTLFLVSFAAACLGFCVSASVSIFAIANLVFSVILIFMLLFGGFLVNLNEMADWLSWLQYLSFFRYAMNALLINEMKDMPFCQMVQGPNGTEHEFCNPEAGNLFLEDQGIRYETAWHLWQNEVGLVVIATIFMALAYVQMRRMKKLK